MKNTDSNPELTALQNSVKYFEIDAVIKLFFEQDKRKKPRFVLSKNDTFVSPPLNYNNMNIFLLGIMNCKRHDNILKLK